MATNGATNGLSHGPDKPRNSIVQCPSCQTKFAVDSSMLEGQQLPRFHCSRCDHVFEMDISTEEERKPVTPVKPQSAEIRPLKSIELPKKIEHEIQVKAPHENPFSEEKEDEEADAKQMEFGFARSDELLDATSEPRQAYEYREGQSFSDDEPRSTRTLEAKNALLVFAVPLFVFLVALVWAGFALKADSSLSFNLSKGLFSGSFNVPPSGLFIKRSRFKKLALSNGEVAYVASGVVQNNSDQILKDVIIEGLVFDEAGNLISKARGSIASGLEDARIRSLTADTIQNLQRAPSSSRYELKAGTEQPFVVALFGPELEKGKYYSARIYSVRY